MIIQCEQCQTKFKLDDSKVSAKGVKVRCARCKHVFAVAGQQPAEEDSAFLWQEEVPPASEAEQEPVAALQDMAAGSGTEIRLEGTSLLDSFAFESEDEQADTGATPGETDLGADFGGLDFSGDSVFGEAAAAKPAETSSEVLAFETGMGDFSDSMGIESPSAGQSPNAPGTPPESPFSLDNIDFGDELTSVAVQQVSTEELKPSEELLFAPLSTGEPDKAAEAPLTAAATSQAEPPPVTSRRKEGQRVSGMLVLLGVLIAGLVVFYSIWGYMTLTADKGAVSKEKETGRITLKSVEASYVMNKKAGELLVIRGEAVNEHDKPQAAIEVKGIIYGAGGEELASRNAFCGNALSREQLATMSIEEINAAMANQFGDSLANMEVAAGDAIPFVIVIPKPAQGASDYGVEAVGSTVAADKGK